MLPTDLFSGTAMIHSQTDMILSNPGQHAHSFLGQLLFQCGLSCYILLFILKMNEITS